MHPSAMRGYFVKLGVCVLPDVNLHYLHSHSLYIYMYLQVAYLRNAVTVCHFRRYCEGSNGGKGLGFAFT